MSRRTARSAALSVLTIGVSCGGDTDQTTAGGGSTVVADLAPGVAARVGEQDIEAALVQRVAAAQKIDAVQARERLVKDALYAEHARSELAAGGRVAVAERAALARVLLERLERDARAEGAPTEQELAEIAKVRWLEFDRPPSARTSHVVVLVQPKTDKAAARRLADRIAQEVRGITDATKFRERAEAVPKGGLRVHAESLPGVTADGRVVSERPLPPGAPSSFDVAFSAAANAIEEVGQQSPVVESIYGFHVILLEERLPEKRIPRESWPKLLGEEALTARARLREQELVERLERSTRIERDRAASALTAEVRVRP
jgi:peptidyl-prolyl cis-trans isomerase C